MKLRGRHQKPRPILTMFGASYGAEALCRGCWPAVARADRGRDDMRRRPWAVRAGDAAVPVPDCGLPVRMAGAVHRGRPEALARAVLLRQGCCTKNRGNFGRCSGSGSGFWAFAAIWLLGDVAVRWSVARALAVRAMSVEVEMKPLTREQYDAIRGLLCPYCAFNLPDVREADRQLFIHSIPRSTETFVCAASAMRGLVPIEGGAPAEPTLSDVMDAQMRERPPLIERMPDGTYRRKPFPL